VHYCQDVIETMGLERERIQMIFVSAAEGARFQQLATKMDKEIRQMGPSKLRKHQHAALVAIAEKAKKKQAKGT
jgi:coenzyme F420-reducing hydrogenase delta subunit